MSHHNRKIVFEPNRLAEYSDDSLLEEIRRVAGHFGDGTLTIAKFQKLSRVGTTTLRRRFGSWSAALTAAGLGHLYNAPAPATKSRTLGRTLSNEELVAELQRVASILGHSSLTADDLNAHALVGPATFRNRFGSLKAAFRAAGLSESAHGKRYADEECFENLLHIWTNLGRPPMYREMSSLPSTVGGKAYVKRWGTWNKALHAFANRVNADDLGANPPQSSAAPINVLKQSMALKPEDRHDIPLGLRWKVLSRDRFRCVVCGISPATSLECKLHVDHIVPFSKGGKTIVDNLRSLCATCNIGKAARIEPTA
jgi:hypothetical protein